MPSSRFVVSTVIAVMLLAGACGGDEDSPTEGQAEVVSIIEGDDISEDAGEEGTADPEPEATTTDAAALPTRIGEVELGDRFPWCSTVNAMWQDFDEATELWDAVNQGLQEAQEAVATATDELDVIEAENVLQMAQGAYEDVSETYDDADKSLRNYVLATRLYVEFPDVRDDIAAQMEQMI